MAVHCLLLGITSLALLVVGGLVGGGAPSSIDGGGGGGGGGHCLDGQRTNANVHRRGQSEKHEERKARQVFDRHQSLKRLILGTTTKHLTDPVIPQVPFLPITPSRTKIPLPFTLLRSLPCPPPPNNIIFNKKSSRT